MERNLCVLFDFDNIAKGSRQEGLGEFDVRIVMRRLKDLGRILVARAYCDWDRWQRHKTRLAEQGVTMVELPATGHGDKNRGDIALVVDAMEIAFNREYLDTFVIVSGDSDFTPLVTRLKELNRRVIGIGTRGSTSRLIANVCDEFMFYDNLVQATTRVQQVQREDDGDVDERGKLKLGVALALLVETLQNVQRDEGGPVHAGVLKNSMKRKVPTFNEGEYGFSTFARFLERAQAEGLVVLRRDDRGGGFKVALSSSAAVDGEPNGNGGEPRRAPLPPVAEGHATEAQNAEEGAGQQAPPPRRLQRPVVEALEALQAEGLDIGLAEDRLPILEGFVAACAERVVKSRRLAIQYLQGDLVQAGFGAEGVRAVLGSLVRTGAVLHPDGDPVRAPTAPIQTPPHAAELNALLEERALEILGSKRLRVGPLVRNAIFAPEGYGADAEAAARDAQADADAQLADSGLPPGSDESGDLPPGPEEDPPSTDPATTAAVDAAAQENRDPGDDEGAAAKPAAKRPRKVAPSGDSPKPRARRPRVKATSDGE